MANPAGESKDEALKLDFERPVAQANTSRGTIAWHRASGRGGANTG
jgi:hypothetical protein